jgi:hypothetical protein
MALCLDDCDVRIQPWWQADNQYVSAQGGVKGWGTDMSNALWFGILVGVLVGTFAPEWARIVVFLIALVLSDLAYQASKGIHNIRNVHNVHNVHFVVSPELIGVVGIVVGLWAWHYARRRGLQHLGRAELNTRWTAVRGISRWGW